MGAAGWRCVNLGDGIVIDFLSDVLPAVLAPEGVCQIWFLLGLPKGVNDTEEFLRKSVRNSDRYRFDTVVVDSPWSVGRQEIQGGKLRRNSWVLREPEHEALFWRFVENHQIEQLVTTVASCRLCSDG